MKKIILIVTLLFLLFSFIELESKVVPENFVYSTVYISNLSTGGSGTGFLVERKISKDSKIIFLISNKHVLLPKKVERESEGDLKAEAIVTVNKVINNEISSEKIKVELRDSSGIDYCKGHPNEEVDVAAIIFTKYITENQQLRLGLKREFITEEKFATKRILKEQYVSIGDRIIVLGYPLSLVEGGHCIPIARGGIISSEPGLNFKGLPMILIDSKMLRGSSGSPVFLTFKPYRFVSKYTISPTEITKSTLLGIVSGMIPDWRIIIEKTITFGKTTYIEITNPADIGVIFRVETIIETIDQWKNFQRYIE
jgi:hypothetical protein